MSEAGKCFSPPLPSFLPSFLRDRLVVSFGGGGGSQLPRRFPPGLEGPSHQASHRSLASQTDRAAAKSDGRRHSEAFLHSRSPRKAFVHSDPPQRGLSGGHGVGNGHGGMGSKIPTMGKTPLLCYKEVWPPYKHARALSDVCSEFYP